MALSTTAVATRPWRLGVNARRAVLIAHIASAGAWLGVDVAMAVVIGTVLTTDDPATRASSLQILELITVWPLLACGLTCLATGSSSGWGADGGSCGTGG